jgi:hypothetical protein
MKPAAALYGNDAVHDGCEKQLVSPDHELKKPHHRYRPVTRIVRKPGALRLDIC